MEPPKSVSPAYRVPRSPVDEWFVRGLPAEPTRAGTAVVVSVESDTCTVLIGDEQVPGVVFMGNDPAVGDAVELETRGDLLVALADDYDLGDAFQEGITTGAAHIVSDTDPGNPPDEPVNITGSFRDLAAWAFSPPDTPMWQRELPADQPGMRVWLGTATVSGVNLVDCPSFEDGVGRWAGNPVFGGSMPGDIEPSTDYAAVGVRSARCIFHAPTGGEPNGNVLLSMPSLTNGSTYTLQLRVRVPAGQPPVRAGALFLADSTTSTKNDEWETMSVTFTAGAGTVFVGVLMDNPPEGAYCYLDAVMVQPGSGPAAAYFDGSSIDTDAVAYEWDGVPHQSTSTAYNLDPAGVPVSPGTGELWNSTVFDVEPGDILHLTVTAAYQDGNATTMEPVVAFGPQGEDAEPGPGTSIISYPPGIVVDTPDETMTADITVPVEVTTVNAGVVTPGRARVGLKFTPGVALTPTWDHSPAGAVWNDSPAGVTWNNYAQPV